ncbi:unnamed protein product [Meloidogyne enterolobii]|uniref:Uncharacterized protein n=1 Tax=Meloidogyne enterolobii TaxID=390850 RepID=A0ACB0ZDT2_MELEN
MGRLKLVGRVDLMLLLEKKLAIKSYIFRAETKTGQIPYVSTFQFLYANLN